MNSLNSNNKPLVKIPAWVGNIIFIIFTFLLASQLLFAKKACAQNVFTGSYMQYGNIANGRVKMDTVYKKVAILFVVDFEKGITSWTTGYKRIVSERNVISFCVVDYFYRDKRTLFPKDWAQLLVIEL